MVKTKKIKIDESSSSADQSTSPTTSQHTETTIVMDTGVQDFAQIRYFNGFVDKTLLIKTVLSQVSRILLIAPRGFGKSVNISMLERFFEILPDATAMAANRKLFENTLIKKKCPDIMSNHCGRYPVLYLNFKSLGSVVSYDNAFELVRRVVQKAYKSHAYLQSSDELVDQQKHNVKRWCDDDMYKTLVKTDEEINEALEQLAEYLVKHYGRKIIVFVDEYDSICSDCINIEDKVNETTGVIISKAETQIKKVIALCTGALSCLLKPDHKSDYVDCAVLTGISYVMTMGLSKLSNVEPFKFQEENTFSEFYGLLMNVKTFCPD